MRSQWVLLCLKISDFQSGFYRYSVAMFFHIMDIQEKWVLTESRIPLKPVLGGVRIVALSISSHEQTQ